METVRYEGEEVEVGATAQISFCETIEAKRLAVIEMQKGLTPFCRAVVLDYLEHCDEFHLSDCLSGTDLETARSEILSDLVFIEMWFH